MERKRKTLSVNRISKKCPQTSVSTSIIDLVSSEDEESSQQLDLSNTVDFAPENTNSSADTIILSPLTPSKSFHTPPKLKYYSPSKNRSVTKKTPSKIKRKLNLSSQSPKDGLFVEACKDMDDKTVFLLSVISKYLNDDSLKKLLDENSQHLLSNYTKVTKPGMRLVCRLYWRINNWFRLGQIKDIMNEKNKSVDDAIIKSVIDSLMENGYIVLGNSNSSNKLPLDDLFSMLKSGELKDICKEFKMKVANKQEAQSSLKAFSSRKSIAHYFGCKKIRSNADRTYEVLSQKAGICYKLSDLARSTLHNLYILMYLGIDHSIIKEKKLELMLIYDKINRETYPIQDDMVTDNASLIFTSKEEFKSYVNAQLIYNDFEDCTEWQAKYNIIEKVHKLYKNMDKETMTRINALPSWLRRFTPVGIFVKILDQGIPVLKKEFKDRKCVELAMDILNMLIAQTAFKQHKEADWCAEKALILDKYLSSPNEAAEVCLQAFSPHIADEFQDVLRKRARNLVNRKTRQISQDLRDQLLKHVSDDNLLENNIHSKHIQKQPMETYNGKVKFQTWNADGTTTILEAEDFCIYHYIKDGEFTHGMHWESKIVVALFFVFFWDIIYANLRGVRGIFLTRFQRYPLDMFSDSFYMNRMSLIHERLKDIEGFSTEELLENLKTRLDARPEGEVSDLNGVATDALSAVCSCLGGARLAALLARLAARPARPAARAGFPDLTLWHQRTKQIKFVEVKTDSDRPSIRQLQWLHYLRDAHIPAEFCYVGVNTTRCRARGAATQEYDSDS